MDKKYRVCIIVPSGYKHSKAFLETALLLKLSLTDNGVDCDIAVNEMDIERTNILLGYHLITYRRGMEKYRYIPYQLEQLSSDDGIYSENIRKLLTNASDVWDYSKENMEFLNGIDVSAKYMPPGYHKGLEKITHNNKDIDLLFFGSVNKRREKVLNEIEKRSSLKKLFGVYQDERDGFISRSKIVLNIHHYSARIFEAVRVSYLLNNRCFVLSEESTVYPYTEVGMPLIPYENIADQCRYYLARPREMEEKASMCYEQYKKYYNMNDMVGDVIKE